MVSGGKDIAALKNERCNLLNGNLKTQCEGNLDAAKKKVCGDGGAKVCTDAFIEVAESLATACGPTFKTKDADSPKMQSEPKQQECAVNHFTHYLDDSTYKFARTFKTGGKGEAKGLPDTLGLLSLTGEKAFTKVRDELDSSGTAAQRKLAEVCEKAVEATKSSCNEEIYDAMLEIYWQTRGKKEDIIKVFAVEEDKGKDETLKFTNEEVTFHTFDKENQITERKGLENFRKYLTEKYKAKKKDPTAGTMLGLSVRDGGMYTPPFDMHQATVDTGDGHDGGLPAPGTCTPGMRTCDGGAESLAQPLRTETQRFHLENGEIEHSEFRGPMPRLAVAFEQLWPRTEGSNWRLATKVTLVDWALYHARSTKPSISSTKHGSYSEWSFLAPSIGGEYAIGEEGGGGSLRLMANLGLLQFAFLHGNLQAGENLGFVDFSADGAKYDVAAYGNRFTVDIGYCTPNLAQESIQRICLVADIGASLYYDTFSRVSTENNPLGIAIEGVRPDSHLHAIINLEWQSLWPVGGK